MKPRNEIAKPMKVCFISHESIHSGAVRALLELIDALRERGVECYVILPSEGPITEVLKNWKISYCILPYKWWADITSTTLWRRMKVSLWNILIAMRLARRLYQWKCHVVVTNSIVICVGALAARLVSLPHIWYIHEFGFEDHGLVFHLGKKFSLGFINQFSTICLANSKTICNHFQQYIAPSKLKMVYYSVIVNQDFVDKPISIEPTSNIICIMVGALQEGKRQEDAIRAIFALDRRNIRANLIIIGPGNLNYQKYLRKLVIENKLENQVKFLSYVENAYPYMQAADVLLICSRSEAFGRVTIEAMKAGKPVIGARSGANPELIKEGFNGLLYAPMNHEDLAEKIYYLCEHPKEGRRMGENGRQWALERFNKDSYGDQVLTILQSLVKPGE